MKDEEKDSTSNAIIAYESLDRMIEALRSGDSLSPELREQIADAIELLYLMQLGEERAHHRGRDPAYITWLAARTALALVERFEASRKDAIAAVITRKASPALFQAIDRACSKLTSGDPQYDEFRDPALLISELAIEKARARLPDRKGTRRNK